VVDHLDGDVDVLRFVERAGGVAVECGLGLGVGFGFQGGLEGAGGVVGAEAAGLADEQALFVANGVDEPAGDSVRAVADDLAGLGFEGVHAVHFDAEFAVFIGEEDDVSVAEDDEQVALAGVLA